MKWRREALVVGSDSYDRILDKNGNENEYEPI